MRNNKYELIALDLDGTLLNPLMKLTDFTRDSLIKINKAGFKLSIISSRGLTDIRTLIKDLPVEYIGALDGAVIFDNKIKKIIDYKPINDSEIKVLINKLLKYKYIAFNLFTDDEVFISKYSSNEFVKHYQDTLNPKLINDFKLKNAGCVHIVIEDENKFDNIYDELKNSFDDIIFKNAGFNFIIANKKNIDKGFALKSITNLLNISFEETIAVVDSEADIPMIKLAGLGIAMKNGSSVLYKEADKVTKITNDNNGAVKLLFEELGL